mmetsp:Transcript_4026/g.6126  ORF Transcript_4026/g.6126 Transcript_4026/m.6126 type:complete len:208 (-) Transcript_4026:368-991(-)
MERKILGLGPLLLYHIIYKTHVNHQPITIVFEQQRSKVESNQNIGKIVPLGNLHRFGTDIGNASHRNNHTAKSQMLTNPVWIIQFFRPVTTIVLNHLPCVDRYEGRCCIQDVTSVPDTVEEGVTWFFKVYAKEPSDWFIRIALLLFSDHHIDVRIKDFPPWLVGQLIDELELQHGTQEFLLKLLTLRSKRPCRDVPISFVILIRLDL